MRANVKKRMTNEELRARTREKLIQATIKEIAKNGYANLTTKGITNRSGVTWGAAQHIFTNRENLVFEAARAASEYQRDKFKEINLDGDIKDRCQLLIRHMWERYQGEEMQAFYEISNGTRNNENMSARLRPFFAEMSEINDKMWQDALADFNQPAERISEIRQLILLTLLGLARRETYLPDPKTVRHVVSLLEELVTYMLSVDVKRLEKNPG